MSSGSRELIKVGFLTEQGSGWIGGINYYKNLFVAMSKVDHPKLVPYILPQFDKKAEILQNYAKPLASKREFKYLIDKVFFKFSGKKLDKTAYLTAKTKVDIISHSQIPTENSTIAWIADFQHLHLPEMFSEDEIKKRNFEFKKLAEDNKIVILSSHDALEDFKKFIPECANKGRVLHFVSIPNIDIYEKTDKVKEKIIKKFNLPEKYFYVPNQFWKHKNHKVIFEAIEILKKEGIDIKVVFTGSTKDFRNSGFFEELIGLAEEKNINENILLLGLVDLIEVHYLMRNCISIINPSLFEGWASTVEEAKSIGKNIILSDIGVHREQNPPEGLYFDPHNAEELAAILKNKWASGSFGPDFELEKTAKEELEKRIKEFGENYQKIILEALSLS